MPLAVQGSELPSGHRRTLYRRSSCPSIPRSVSSCSSIYAIDFVGEFPTMQKDCDDVEMYMSPLFRGLGGIGEEHGDEAELMAATSTGDFMPRAEAVDSDDSLSDSDSLSNYQFDITGHDLFPEPTKASTAELSTEQPSTSVHPRSLRAPEKPLKIKASQLFPPPRDPPPSPEHIPPPVPPKPTQSIIPMESCSTRPLKIDRSRKRAGPSVTSQRTSLVETQNVVPTSKPISRATTHVNLREAYRRDRLLSERKVPARGVTPVRPSHPCPRPKTPDRNVTQQIPPITTLFPTGLIPLDRAQDKFKHAHCLDRLPPKPDLADSSTLSSGNPGQWSRSRGWPFGRAFKKPSGLKRPEIWGRH